VNFWLAICVALSLGFLAGNYTALLAVRWALKQKEIINQLLADAYHKDLLPEVARILGLINLALLEWPHNLSFMKMYLEKAQEQCKQHKDNIESALKKYHNWS
jgi:ABC-type uncharacterized transport system permease subunit